MQSNFFLVILMAYKWYTVRSDSQIKSIDREDKKCQWESPSIYNTPSLPH